MSERIILPQKVGGRSIFLNGMSSLVGMPLATIRREASIIGHPSGLEEMDSILGSPYSENAGFLQRVGKVYFFLGTGCGRNNDAAPHIHMDGPGGMFADKHTLLRSGWRASGSVVFSEE